MDEFNPIMAVTDLTYATYRFNRDNMPEILPQRWALLFGDVTELEARYQEERHARSA